jgi:hypothetical protein
MSEMKRTHNNEETIMNDGERGNKQNRRKWIKPTTVLCLKYFEKKATGRHQADESDVEEEGVLSHLQPSAKHNNKRRITTLSATPGILADNSIALVRCHSFRTSSSSAQNLCHTLDGADLPRDRAHDPINKEPGTISSTN